MLRRNFRAELPCLHVTCTVMQGHSMLGILRGSPSAPKKVGLGSSIIHMRYKGQQGTMFVSRPAWEGTGRKPECNSRKQPVPYVFRHQYCRNYCGHLLHVYMHATVTGMGISPWWSGGRRGKAQALPRCAAAGSSQCRRYSWPPAPCSAAPAWPPAGPPGILLPAYKLENSAECKCHARLITA